jgi:hypothetical protein
MTRAFSVTIERDAEGYYGASVPELRGCHTAAVEDRAWKIDRDLVKLLLSDKEIENWYVNPEMPEEAVRDFEELGKGKNGLEKQKRLLAELLDKNQLYVNLSEIDDA